ncbi:hypothetical protein AWC38_SpisGene13004 [Stylophora pistillata]|uniref:Uncharacterized protein n=1 Tax=Stylophora pistillata TaxID=50429 RepID=A0A2B4RZA8_STYPI|nr:hypothetical protein AWC38_SpisGene13004 [Stylophora pistillata]
MVDETQKQKAAHKQCPTCSRKDTSLYSNLGDYYSGPLGLGHGEGLPDRILSDSFPDPFPCPTLYVSFRRTGGGRGDTEPPQKRCNAASICKTLGFVSNIYLHCPKKGGGTRPVMNLKGLNVLTAYHHFKMEDLSLLKKHVEPRGMDRETRSQGCVFHYPYAQRPLAIPKTPMETLNVRIHLPAFRAQSESKSVYEGSRNSCGILKETRGQPCTADRIPSGHSKLKKYDPKGPRGQSRKHPRQCLHDWRMTLVVVAERPWLERSPLINGIVAVLGSCVASEDGLDPMARSVCRCS